MSNSACFLYKSFEAQICKQTEDERKTHQNTKAHWKSKIIVERVERISYILPIIKIDLDLFHLTTQCCFHGISHWLSLHSSYWHILEPGYKWRNRISVSKHTWKQNKGHHGYLSQRMLTGANMIAILASDTAVPRNKPIPVVESVNIQIEPTIIKKLRALLAKPITK